MIPHPYHTLDALGTLGQTAGCRPRREYWATTSFPEIDSILLGLDKGTVTLLSGVQGSGKSVLAARIGAYTIQEKLKRVLHVGAGPETYGGIIDRYSHWLPGYNAAHLGIQIIREDCNLADGVQEIIRQAQLVKSDLVIVDALEMLSQNGCPHYSDAKAAGRLKAAAINSGFALVLVASGNSKQVKIRANYYESRWCCAIPPAVCDHELRLGVQGAAAGIGINRIVRVKRIRGQSTSMQHSAILPHFPGAPDIIDELTRNPS